MTKPVCDVGLRSSVSLLVLVLATEWTMSKQMCARVKHTDISLTRSAVAAAADDDDDDDEYITAILSGHAAGR